MYHDIVGRAHAGIIVLKYYLPIVVQEQSGFAIGATHGGAYPLKPFSTEAAERHILTLGNALLGEAADKSCQDKLVSQSLLIEENHRRSAIWTFYLDVITRFNEH